VGGVHWAVVPNAAAFLSVVVVDGAVGRGKGGALVIEDAAARPSGISLRTLFHAVADDAVVDRAIGEAEGALIPDAAAVIPAPGGRAVCDPQPVQRGGDPWVDVEHTPLAPAVEHRRLARRRADRQVPVDTQEGTA
jgi:hypothetical protein